MKKKMMICMMAVVMLLLAALPALADTGHMNYIPLRDIQQKRWQNLTRGGTRNMAFPQSFMDELVARSDIVDVVGSYVQLSKRSGSNLAPEYEDVVAAAQKLGLPFKTVYAQAVAAALSLNE